MLASRGDKITSPGEQQQKQAALSPGALNVRSQRDSFCFIPSSLLLPYVPVHPHLIPTSTALTQTAESGETTKPFCTARTQAS